MAKIDTRKPRKKVNPLKAAKVKTIDYKDTALLRKFISDRGKIRLPAPSRSRANSHCSPTPAPAVKGN